MAEGRVRALANFEVPEKARSRNTLAILAHELGQLIAELADLEGQKIERGSSTISSRHPENSTLSWSDRGRESDWLGRKACLQHRVTAAIS